MDKINLFNEEKFWLICVISLLLNVGLGMYADIFTDFNFLPFIGLTLASFMQYVYVRFFISCNPSFVKSIINWIIILLFDITKVVLVLVISFTYNIIFSMWILSNIPITLLMLLEVLSHKNAESNYQPNFSKV